MAITPTQLREAREVAGLTQTDLAAHLGVSVRTIVNWESERGQGVPRKMERKVNQHFLIESTKGSAADASVSARRAALAGYSDLQILQELSRRAREREQASRSG